MDPLFFSYSRADSEFVLKLAKDLRLAGVNLWIDQLDIAPGDRWDRAVEQALGAAPCLLVVLSPTSANSQNVMDEVSLAFDEQKKVVPVLFQKCNIPFRLRRLQYVDFTSKYDDGLAQLLSALKTVGHGAAQAVDENPGKPTAVLEASTDKNAGGPADSSVGTRSDLDATNLGARGSRKFSPTGRSLYLLLGLILALAAFGFAFLSPFSKRIADHNATQQPQVPSDVSGSAKKGANYFAGAWENTDSNTRGITRVNVRVDGSSIFVHVWGKCHPNDCDWGEVVAEAYGVGVSTPATADIRTIAAVFKTNFSETSLSIRPEAHDMLNMDALTHFTDNSGRANYTSSFSLRRAS